jgi:hypothetical protein
VADDPRLTKLEGQFSDLRRSAELDRNSLSRQLKTLDDEVRSLRAQPSVTQRDLVHDHPAPPDDTPALNRALDEQRERLRALEDERRQLLLRLSAAERQLGRLASLQQITSDRFPKNARTSATEGHLHSLIPQAGAGTPTHVAAEGTPYWDITNDLAYINSDGAATWQARFPQGFTFASATLASDVFALSGATVGYLISAESGTADNCKGVTGFC